MKKVLLSLSYEKEEMPSLSARERKTKLRVAIKEFNDKLLDLVMIQDKMEKFTLLMSNN